MKLISSRLAAQAILALFAVNPSLTEAQPSGHLFRHTGSLGNRVADEMFVRLVERPTTARAAFAHIERNAFNDERLQLNLFHDPTLEATQTAVDFSGSLYRVWSANLANNQGSAIFIINGDRISGKIDSSLGAFEVFPTSDGGCIVVEHFAEKFPGCPAGEQTAPAGTQFLDTVDIPIPNAGADTFDEVPSEYIAADATPLFDTPSENRVRIIVAYTASARVKTLEHFGRTMKEQISLAIAEANQGYANSGVDMRIELACLYQTDFVETYAIENDVAAFQNNGDGKADEVHQLRADYDADMCSLITDGRDILWCGDSYGFDYTSRENMFQATSYLCVTSILSFAHEFGHTQGCRHNDDPETTPLAYGHGFRNESNWRTIMALANTTSAPRLNYWSNPDIDSPVEPCTPMGTPVNGALFANDSRSALNTSDDLVVNHETTPSNSTAPTGYTFETDEYADKVVLDTLSVAAFTARSGSTIQFRAGSSIVLQTGFEARAGSAFHARLTTPSDGAAVATDSIDENAATTGQNPVQ